MTRTVTLVLLSLALLGLPGTALAEDDPSLSADVDATVSADPGEADQAPFGVTPDLPETPPSDGSDDEDRDDENHTADEHRKDGEHRRDGNASGEDPDENSPDDSRDEDRPSVPQEPRPPESPERDAVFASSSDNETEENETRENETEDDEEEPVLDPMAPTHISTRARGPGPIDDARVGATVYHNTTKAGFTIYEELILEPTTRVGAVDEAAQDATEATPVHDLLWGWRFTHDDEGGVILDLE